MTIEKSILNGWDFSHFTLLLFETIYVIMLNRFQHLTR